MNFVSKIRETYHTLRHVKPVQLSYRLKYRLSPVSSLEKTSHKDVSFTPIPMLPLPYAQKFAEITDKGLKVTFLNKSESYSNHINWADMKHGKLWNYHLQYADLLKQNDLSVDFRQELILSLYSWLNHGKLQPEPYPASLRIMNVIRFLSTHHKQLESDDELTQFVYSELNFLENRLEYHLLGNHLMENAFALLMGGAAFQNQDWILKAKMIFEEQIPEQILEDGAHFERSPMYHLILLFRFLEAIYYLPSDSKLSSQFFGIAKKKLGWIDQMSFRNDDLAHFNDSTDHQAFTKNEMVALAETCSIKNFSETELSESGYKKFLIKPFELLVDADGIQPASQPGHAHADSLSFILHVNGQPFITDPGVSTYEIGERRNWERSTKAHNTVTYNGQNTAGVWSRFRVGRRPEVSVLASNKAGITIHLKSKLHSGELFEHQRTFAITDDFIEIKDQVNVDKSVEGRLYFDPETKIKSLSNQHAEFTDGTTIHFTGVEQLSQLTYEYCEGFNLRKKASGIEYRFMNQASLKIEARQV